MISVLLKISFLGVLDALAIPILVGSFRENLGIFVVFLLGILGLNVSLLSRRAYPLRYLLPGMFVFGLMVVYPIVYNVNVAFMRYGTGNLLSKEQVIEQLTSKYYQPEDAERFRFFAFRVDGEWRILLKSERTGKIYEAIDGRLVEIEDRSSLRVNENGDVIALDGIERASLVEIVKNLDFFQDLSFEYIDGKIVRFYSVNEFRVMMPMYSYDPERDALIDNRSGKIFRPIDGFFTSEDGEKLSPGFRDYVGFSNFIEIITNPNISKPFFRVFVWTFTWAFLSVLLTFSLGLSLALALNDQNLKHRYLYRTILMVPYAVPVYISVLVWKGLFNTSFGAVNAILDVIFKIRIDWLHDPFWAKVALLTVNLWLGFPYMMLISLGALQSIPREVYEAAKVDGANGWQRFWKITMPLLMVSLAPLLVGSFAFNFNNFTVIYLLTGGGPPIPGSETPAGSTDILISYTYKLAFGTSGAQYGYAAAISVMIFLIVGTISSLGFRLTKRLEEIGKFM